MCNDMLKAFLIAFLIITTSFNKQANDNRFVHINDIGWTFQIPAPLKFTDSCFDMQGGH